MFISHTFLCTVIWLLVVWVCHKSRLALVLVYCLIVAGHFDCTLHKNLIGKKKKMWSQNVLYFYLYKNRSQCSPSLLSVSRVSFHLISSLSSLLSVSIPLSVPLHLFQPSLPTLMQIWAWTDGSEQKVFTCTQLLTKRADACRAAAPLQSPWYRNMPDRRRGVSLCLNRGIVLAFP